MGCGASINTVEPVKPIQNNTLTTPRSIPSKGSKSPRSIGASKLTPPHPAPAVASPRKPAELTPQPSHSQKPRPERKSPRHGNYERQIAQQRQRQLSLAEELMLLTQEVDGLPSKEQTATEPTPAPLLPSPPAAPLTVVVPEKTTVQHTDRDRVTGSMLFDNTKFRQANRDDSKQSVRSEEEEHEELEEELEEELDDEDENLINSILQIQ